MAGDRRAGEDIEVSRRLALVRKRDQLAVAQWPRGQGEGRLGSARRGTDSCTRALLAPNPHRGAGPGRARDAMAARTMAASGTMGAKRCRADRYGYRCVGIGVTEADIDVFFLQEVVASRGYHLDHVLCRARHGVKGVAAVKHCRTGLVEVTQAVVAFVQAGVRRWSVPSAPGQPS